MAEPKGFFRRIFSFGTSDRPEAERTPEHGQTPIPNDTPQVVTPGAPDADLHAPAAASTLADSEAGAQPEDGGGITPLTSRSSSETAEKKSPEIGVDGGEPAGGPPEPAYADARFEAPAGAALPGPAPSSEFVLPFAVEPAVEVADPISADSDAPLPEADDSDFSFLDAPSAPAQEPRADFSWLEEPVAPIEDEPEDETGPPFEADESILVAEDGGDAAEPAPFDPDLAPPTAADRDEFGWLDAPLPPEPEETTPPVDPELSDRIDVVPGGESPLPGVPVTPPLAPAPAGEGWRVRETAPPVSAAAAEARWLDRLRGGLSRSSGQLSGQITSLFTKRRLDEATLQDFEDVMIQADLGLETAVRITDRLSEGRFGREISGGEVRRILAEEVEKTLDPVAMPLELDLSVKPHVILVVGVNGTGKTTTIGKLAAKLTRGGLKVTMAAGDTFRAAAVEQLKVWGERTGSTVVAKAIGADAAGLAFEAYDEAVANGSDVLIVDTAGRLQNKAELMAELEKIVRVLGRREPGAPHTVLQTLDATTGQNALSQVEIFRNVAGVNGLVMTKLDGTARGGILVAIAAKHRLPVFFVGVGEGVDDLEPFRAKDYAAAIAGTAA